MIAPIILLGIGVGDSVGNVPGLVGPFGTAPCLRLLLKTIKFMI